MMYQLPTHDFPIKLPNILEHGQSNQIVFAIWIESKKYPHTFY